MHPAEQPGQLLFVGFEGTQLPEDLAACIASGRVGGAVLFARNVESPAQLRALVAALHAAAPARAPLTVAIDQEGGRVQRCRAPWTEWPPMRTLGAAGEIDATRSVARGLARELADLRIDLDFAPCVDVDGSPPDAIIGDRSFSASAETVARHAVAFVEALQAEGVAGCAKHFPGHGGTVCDSHHELPHLDRDLARLRAVDLVPFAATARAGVASVMTAHIVVPQLDPERPSTMSPDTIALLRDEIGYDGLVFSDDLEMKAVADHFTPAERVTQALAAGVDSLLVCSRADLREEVLQTLESLPDAAVEAGLLRMRSFKSQYSGGRHASGGGPPYPEHSAVAARLSDPGGRNA